MGATDGLSNINVIFKMYLLGLNQHLSYFLSFPLLEACPFLQSLCLCVSFPTPYIKEALSSLKRERERDVGPAVHFSIQQIVSTRAHRHAHADISLSLSLLSQEESGRNNTKSVISTPTGFIDIRSKYQAKRSPTHAGGR